MKVVVVYALPDKFWSFDLEIEEGSQVSDVLRIAKEEPGFTEIPSFTLDSVAIWGKQVDIAKEEPGFTEIPSFTLDSVAIWGKQVDIDHPVEPGDRIEILRPLPEHPMEKRRRIASEEAM